MRTPIAALAAVFLFHQVICAAISWDPVPREELAITEPSFQSDAGVEVLFRETSVDESEPEASITKTHVRYKVFDQRGVEALQKIDIRYDSKEARVTSVGARVIKPDGTIVNVERKSFFTREVVRNRYYRYKAISFSLPGLEPGVIVEYKVTLQSEPNYFGFFPLQDEYPTRAVRFRLKPPQLPRLQLLSLYFRCPNLQPKPEKGFFTFSLEMVPPAKNEPFAPPDEQVRSWMIYYYTFEERTPEKFWSEIGRDLFKENEKLLKPRPEIHQACAAIIAGATTDREKLERIDAFCRTEIRNLSGDVSGYTPEQIDKLKRNKGPADTLANKYGTGVDLLHLYASLARAAGLDARLARCSDRSRMAFDKNMVVGLMLPDTIVAVRVDGSWWFAQPNVSYLPFGALHWTDEGETVLVADPKDPPLLRTQVTPAEHTQRKRTAHLTLAEDGTLEGDVTIEYTGHLAVSKKEELDDETPGRREELVREDVTDRLPAAEVTNIVPGDVTAPAGSLTLQYHLKLPGYAPLTGQRLFIQPSIFEVGSRPVFTAEERQYSIFFPYQSAEVDHVEIKLPEGFALENAFSPEALDPSPTLEYTPRISYRKRDRTLIYDRTFSLSLRTVASAQYDLLKKLFEHIHRQDAHSVGIRREEPSTATAEGSPAN